MILKASFQYLKMSENTSFLFSALDIL